MSARNWICRLFADARGATAVEYGLIVAMICIAALATLQTVATASDQTWDIVADEVSNSN